MNKEGYAIIVKRPNADVDFVVISTSGEPFRDVKIASKVWNEYVLPQMPGCTFEIVPCFTRGGFMNAYGNAKIE